MRIQSIVLEDHRDIAILRSDVVHQLVADVQLAFGDLLEAGDHTQRRGLAAAGRADQNDKFLVLDVQIEFLNSDNALIGDLKVGLFLDRLVILLLFLLFLFSTYERIDFLNIDQTYFCHTFLTLTALHSQCAPSRRPGMAAALRHVSTVPHRKSCGC